MSKQRQIDLLINTGVISQSQLERAQSMEKETGECLGRALIRLGYVTETELISFYEFQLCISRVSLSGIEISADVLRAFPQSIAERYKILPIRKQGRKLTVVMSDPVDDYVIDDIKAFSGLDIQPAVASEVEILQAIDKFYHLCTPMAYPPEYVETIWSEDDSSIVNMVNAVIKQAFLERASDIHIEPSEVLLRIRFRIDGLLREFFSFSMKIHAPFISRIKVMSNLDIAEKRLPQDGRMHYQIDGDEFDLRISVMPTILGEKIVMRLLNLSAAIISIEKLGFSALNLEKYRKLYGQPYGMILVTGPTGSGKTTTLYSTLSSLNIVAENILTIEDPVEYRLPGINQVQVNPKAGLTFASGLRSMLRQDPNIMMIGEIRDGETANIAVRAALTGHLVFSTGYIMLVYLITKKKHRSFYHNLNL